MKLYAITDAMRGGSTSSISRRSLESGLSLDQIGQTLSHWNDTARSVGGGMQRADDKRPGTSPPRSTVLSAALH